MSLPFVLALGSWQGHAELMGNDDHLHIPADAAFSRRIPELDDRERLVCDACEYVIYENPKIVVGVVATW